MICRGLTGLIIIVLCVMKAAADDPGAMRSSIMYKSLTPGFDISFVFDKEYRCGRYANGDWWVVADPATGTAVLKQITPDYKDGQNGWCVNPGLEVTQPYDKRSRLKFDPSLIPALPYKARAGESIVKAASSPVKILHSYIRYAAVLTVVAAPPENPSETFRPPFSGTYKPLFSTRSLKTDLLPALAKPPHAISEKIAEERTANVRLDYSSHWAGPDTAPADATHCWGAEMARNDAEVFLWLCLDNPVEKKLKTLIGMVQYGIDLYAARRLGCSWVSGGGGNGAGRLLPLTFAATLLDSGEIKNELKKSLTGKPYNNTFWESEMFHRSPVNGMVLWGMKADWPTEELYWKSLSVSPDFYKANCDLYGYIDGAALPGQQYHGCVSMPVKYTALVLHLMPEVKNNWPEKDIKIIEYADRWTKSGVHARPDPVAPAVKLTAAQWADRAKYGYGTTWGPDPANPGQAIKGAGRFPAELHGKYVNSKDFPASRKSIFGEEMWNAYRNMAK